MAWRFYMLGYHVIMPSFTSRAFQSAYFTINGCQRCIKNNRAWFAWLLANEQTAQ